LKHTQLQTSYGIILLALADGRPRTLNLKEILEHYIRHRKEVVIRRARYELEKARDRAHILEGLLVAVANIDKIIKLIRASKTPEIAKQGLMDTFDLSERQARAILELQLQRLTALERHKIDEEYAGILQRIKELEEVLKSEKKVLQIIKEELAACVEKFGDERRTQLTRDESSLEMEIEDLVADEDMVVTISSAGYVKRSPLAGYRKQKRGGVGVTSAKHEEDFTEHLFVASTHDHLLLFTSKGKAYSIRVHQLPLAARTAKGKFVKNFVSLNQGEKISSIIPIRKFEPNQYVVMMTKLGVTKRCGLDNFDNVRKSGIAAINLHKDDELIQTRLTDGTSNIFAATHLGKAIHFPEKDIRVMGRSAAGVRGMNLGNKDYIVGMEVVDKDDYLLTVTEKGCAKRTKASEYRLQSRGGKGITNIKVTDKNGPAIGMQGVRDHDDLMVMSSKGMIVRLGIKDLRDTGRATQGVRVINLKPGDKVATMTVIEAEESLADSSS
jgi:DNA gyrase subunit A